MGEMQMGQWREEAGRGTVRMGRREEAEMGGSGIVDLGVFSSVEGDLEVCFVAAAVAVADGGKEGSTGGGSSMFSAALRDSWRAKSEACHHSRNLRAKMEVGRRIFRLLSRRGWTARARLRGLNMLPPSPGRAGPRGLGAVRASMAAWSAAPRRRMRVPMIHRKGEWYFVPSKR